MKFIALFHSIDLQFITRPTYFVNRIIIYKKIKINWTDIKYNTCVHLLIVIYISWMYRLLYIIQELPSNSYKYIA